MNLTPAEWFQLQFGISDGEYQKLTLPNWLKEDEPTWWVKPLYVGRDYFFAIDSDDQECMFELGNDWMAYPFD